MSTATNENFQMTTKIDALILHTDGSCVPNPGDAGWGFHGFAYSVEPPKKGSGNPDYYVTDHGYVEKYMLDTHRKGENPFDKLDQDRLKEGTMTILEAHMEAIEVTPVFYVDSFGPLGTATNNAGEINGLIHALEFALREGIRTVRIYADSEYTIDGYNLGLPLWQRNNWYRRDGTEIKNKELWQHLWKLKAELKDYDVKLSWLPGHSIFRGNQLADVNANLGKNMTLAGLTTHFEKKSEAQGYWKIAEVDRHPLMAHQKLFFNSDHAAHEPGRYYMGAIDKDIGLFGKRLSDTSYSVIQTKEPIDSIESLIDYHCKMAGDVDETVIGHLNSFYKADVYQQFTEYGNFSLYQPNRFNNNLQSVDKQIVTEVVDPPKKSLEAILAINNVSQWLNAYLENKPEAERFTITDLTPHLYESSVVQKKKEDVTVTKLHASIKPGVASITVDANFRDSSGQGIVLPTILSFGIDLSDRNGLKRIEDLSPKVTLLSWEETPGVFRYFTVIQAGDDTGAYCGYYSNVRLNKAKEKKSSKK